MTTLEDNKTIQEKKGGDANTPNATRILWMSNSPLVS